MRENGVIQCDDCESSIDVSLVLCITRVVMSVVIYLKIDMCITKNYCCGYMIYIDIDVGLFIIISTLIVKQVVSI